MQISPSDAEAKGLVAWLKQPESSLSDLAEPEQWLATISSIPSFQTKVAALIFQRQYNSIVQDATASLTVIDAACEQVTPQKLDYDANHMPKVCQECSKIRNSKYQHFLKCRVQKKM